MQASVRDANLQMKLEKEAKAKYERNEDTGGTSRSPIPKRYKEEGSILKVFR